MRSIFDQYEQPENRLTHALATCLHQDRSLLIPFLRWLGIQVAPKAKSLRLLEQQLPGSTPDDSGEIEHRGLPDVAIFDDEGWVALIECKIQSKISTSQLARHKATVVRRGFEKPWVVVISVDSLTQALPAGTLQTTWRETYAWFRHRCATSFWAAQLVEYMETFERKMLAQEYQIRGTITMFDGLAFDEENPYTYHEGKRLIRLLGDELQSRHDLYKIGVDPQGKRRPAITGAGADGVWDFLPLRKAQKASQFTAFPHLTMAINRKHAFAAITIPNGVKGGFRSKLSDIGRERFLAIVCDLEKRLRPVVKRSAKAKPMIYATQRHYRSQKSEAEIDARIEADLRTAVRVGKSSIKHQPQWIEAIYELLVNKRSNIQFGMEVSFDYGCPLVRSAQASSLFADTWKALTPLIDFVIEEA